MERCARSLARSVGYVGVATVEFLYTLETREYFFLELNPRLQVRRASPDFSGIGHCLARVLGLEDEVVD
jgi:acetyl/propionyl-CoA carboxylase alpha subunit